MAKYNGSVELISGITPANGQDFPLVAAHAIQVDDEGTRLDEALKNVSTDIRKGKHRQVGKACLWYHNLYDWGNTDDEAAANLAQNDIVVAGGNLYANAGTKEDRTRQLNIITKAKTANPNLKLFFYITIASWRKDGDWSHILGKGGYWDAEEAAKHPGAVRIHTKWEIFQLLEYAAHVGGSKNGKKQFIETYTWVDDKGITHTEDKYIDLYEGGISLDGCFYDDAGMEAEEGRVNQGFPSVLREKYIQLVDFTHSKGLAAFPNQLSEDWYADTVSTANPNGLPSSVGADDYMPSDARSQKRIKKAVCSLTEIIYQIELAEKNAVSQASASATDICVGGKSTGVVTSVSSGSESISYATPQQIGASAKEWSAVYAAAGDVQKTNDLLLKTALPLLMGVRTNEGIPILYAGFQG